MTLLSSSPGWFNRLCEEYGIPRPQFDEANIHTLRRDDRQALADLRDDQDHRAAGDSIIEIIRSLTSDPLSAVHVSIAGGRKTMGFFAGYALSLIGREQDCLSHVLVPPLFESHPEFFYPTKTSRIIYTPPPDSRPLDTSQARVALAEIPILRLRRFIPEDFLNREITFSGAVETARLSLEAPVLILHPATSRIEVAGKQYQLPPAEMAFLCWFARRQLAGLPSLACPSEGVAESEYSTEYLHDYRSITADNDRTPMALRHGMEKSFFLERKSRLHGALKRALGSHATHFQIKSFGKRPDTTYRLDLPADCIKIIPPSQESRK